MVDEQAQIVALHKQRGALKRKVTDLKAFINTLNLKADDPKQLIRSDIIELETRIERLTSFPEQLQSIQEKVYSLSISTDIEEEYASEVEANYFSVISAAKLLLETALEGCNAVVRGNVGSNSGSSPPSSVSNITLNNIKLPIITLPKFNGQYVKWLEFRDTFVSLIHGNEALGDVQRFHYLKAALEGDAADIIKSLQISAANYDIAWKLLCERYTNKKLLIQNHIRELFQLKEITKESAFQLREMLDTATKHLRSLEALEQPVKQWDTMMIYLISSKFDKRTARDWESFKISNELPTLDELKTFLNSKADMLDNLTLCHNQSNDTKLNVDSKYSKDKLRKSFVVSNATCYHCKGPHAIYNCEKFIQLPVNDRISQIKFLKLCYNCFRNTHMVEQCTSGGCKKYKRKHNTLLHHEPARADSTTNQLSLSAHHVSASQVLLATASVKIRDVYGKFHLCRALLDSASQSNFITLGLQTKLGIKKFDGDISIQGINQVISPIKSQCLVRIESRVKQFGVELKCLIIDKISDDLPNSFLQLATLNLPDNLPLADPIFDTPDKIDLLIGAQLFWSLIIAGQVKLGKDLPLLQNTQFGWILSGPIPSGAVTLSHCYLSKTLEVQEQLQRFWELEECPTNRPLSHDEQVCESYFLDTVVKTNNEGYIVSLPFKDSTDKLGESKSSAIKRFHALERKFKVHPILKESYIQFMRDYESLGYMSKISNPDDETSHYYMPHHGVINESSKTTRLRVVFDASCPTTSGISLNKLQLVGPTLQDDLFMILIRFRQHAVAFSADIQKMYRQIRVKPDERKFQRIVWREESSQKLEVFELNTVTYGTASAPYLAIRCLIKTADDNFQKFPNACSVIKSDFYVDDILSGAETSEEAITLCKEISVVLQESNFTLHKWVSNDLQVLSVVKSQSDQNEICIASTNMTKALGLYWQPTNDTLNYKISLVPISDTVTKRKILSIISTIFDPLGLLSAFTIIGKIVLQSLWQENLNWDDPVPKSIACRWNRFQSMLLEINHINVLRWVMCSAAMRIELHGFSDASELAYGACIYLRSFDSSGNIHVNLLCAKAKVAPLKRLTIPKLELCGAHLLSKLVAIVNRSLRVKIDSINLWTDSTIVLGWINSSPSILKVFVSHRVADIQEKTKEYVWRHVPTDENPADLASRGISASQLTHAQLWWHGPGWLSRDNSQWPNQYVNISPDTLPEVKRNKLSILALSRQYLIQFTRFSNYERLLRSMSYCFRFIKNCQTKERQIGPLTTEEIKLALFYLIRCIQEETFSRERHCLKTNKPLSSKSNIINLNPFLDSEGILRVGGRLQRSNLDFNQKHQICLPKHHFTRLLFDHKHKRLAHAGPQQLLASLRDQFWPLNGRDYA